MAVIVVSIIHFDEPVSGGVASVDLTIIAGTAVVIGLALIGFTVMRQLRAMTGRWRRTRQALLLVQVAWMTYAAWHFIDTSARAPRWSDRAAALVVGFAGIAILEGASRAIQSRARLRPGRQGIAA